MQLQARIAAGLLCSLAIALFALRRGSLSRSGAVAALVIGSAVYAGGGPFWFLALVAFFASSSALGKLGRARKAALKRDFEKGDTRDAWQASANGGVAALSAFAMAIAPHPCFLGAFLGALATANGDTWATELGTLSAREPISLWQWKRVPRGSSGAVSPLGLLATALGGALIGAVLAADPDARALLSGPLLVLLGVACGVLGSLTDSLLGASVQAEYHCPRCVCKTEGKLHHCGERSERRRGLSWFGNDLVNVSATLAGAGIGALALLAAG